MNGGFATALDGYPFTRYPVFKRTPDFSAARLIYILFPLLLLFAVYTDFGIDPCLALALVGGAVEPKFAISSLSDEKTLKQKAIITDSDANILKEVNGMPALKYLETPGLTKDGELHGASTIPFVVDFGDGTKPVIRAIFAQTPEGYAVCGGAMPVNSTLAIGTIDYEDVLDTAGQLINEIRSTENVQAAILFSCVGRNYALEAMTMDEMQLIEVALGGHLPYMLAYSGGEICPLTDTDGKQKNRFHNDTIIACLL